MNGRTVFDMVWERSAELVRGKQTDFYGGKRGVAQVFTERQLMQKATEINRKMVIAFVEKIMVECFKTMTPVSIYW